MWRTEIGDRVLRGAEWELFRQALHTLWHEVNELGEPGEWDWEVSVFVELQRNQKYWLLAAVAEAMSDESVPCPDLTACLEGAVWAVFYTIRSHVDCEIEIEEMGDAPEGESARYWRTLICAATAEAGLMMVDLINGSLDLTELEEMEFLVGQLAGRVFCERSTGNFELAGVLQDAPPALCGRLKRHLGIAKDYFTAVPPDPRDDELPQIRARFWKAVGCDLPPPGGLMPGFEDRHHGLLVGPCEPGQIAREIDCAVIREVGAFEFDCLYDEWVRNFREPTRVAVPEWLVELPDPHAVLPAGLLAQAMASSISGEPIVMESGKRIERIGPGWVIRNALRCYLSAAYDGWLHCDDEEAVREANSEYGPLILESPQRAMVALFRYEEISRAFDLRHDEAMRVLGRTDPGD
jgi:hypothetical protein